MKHLLVCLFFCSLFEARAQVSEDSARFDEVRSLVNFYKYMLNTVGSDQNSARDKEVIISESYKKVFKDQHVQIEDDLTADRKVITNKDVSAYLRDVDFFFKHIQFDFKDVTVEKIYLTDSSYYFLASFESTMSGTTYSGENQNQSKRRFIELNLNEKASDLKIVSVYSTKVSREKELQLWWESLPFEWVTIFNQQVTFDSISNITLKKIASIDSLDLSGNPFIQDLEPLSALKDLKFLNVSNTKISDLNPLRFARQLTHLDVSETITKDISVLQYFSSLKVLNLAGTNIEDVSMLSRLDKIKDLDLSSTSISDFSSIKEIKSLRRLDLSNSSFDDPTLLSSNVGLKELNLSRTPVDHLFVFQSLPQLEWLNLSETSIVNLNGLEKHPKLKEIIINQTKVKDLAPLVETPDLQKVYADFTGVTEIQAADFMSRRSQVVVVTNSQQVMDWWVKLPSNWKAALALEIGHDNPTKEELAKLLVVDSLNLSNKKLYIEKPLTKFKRLRYLDISHNDFVTLEFAKQMPDLEQLICTHMPIESTADLMINNKLKVLNISNSKLKDLSNLDQAHKLEILDVENTKITENQVVDYLNINSNTVVIYKSDSLLAWWNNLTPAWQQAFNLSNPDRYELHQLVENQELELSNVNIQSLAPLSAFIHLQSIKLDRMQLTSIQELFVHKQLKSLSYTNGPLQTLEGIDALHEIQSLDISNTAMEDLKDLYYLSSLKHLNCSRTGLKNLKGIEKLVDIESLDISNTRIWRLDRLGSMRRLKSLICNNTRISQAKVDDFKSLHPDCVITFY